jgi:hypothetical protein
VTRIRWFSIIAPFPTPLSSLIIFLIIGLRPRCNRWLAEWKAANKTTQAEKFGGPSLSIKAGAPLCLYRLGLIDVKAQHTGTLILSLHSQAGWSVPLR